jgi:hypothetical protein
VEAYLALDIGNWGRVLWGKKYMHHSTYFMQKTGFSSGVVSWVWDPTGMQSRIMNTSPFSGCTLHHLRYTLSILIVATRNSTDLQVLASRAHALDELIKKRRRWWVALIRDIRRNSREQPFIFCHPCSHFWHMHSNTDCGICVVIGTGYPSLLTDKSKGPALSIVIFNTYYVVGFYMPLPALLK